MSRSVGDVPTQRERPGSGLFGYGLAVGSTLVIFLLRAALDPLAGNTSPYILFYFSVIVAAIVGGWGPGLLALGLGTAVATWFFVPVRQSFAIAYREDVVLLLLFLGTAGFVVALGGWAHRVRSRAIRAARRHAWTLESMDDGYLLMDAEARVLDMNRKAEQLLQRSREELLSRSLWEQFPGAEELRFGQEYHRALQEQISVRFEEFYPPLEKWLEFSAYPVPEGLAAFFRDVTERHRHHEAMQEATRQAEGARQAAEEASRAKDHFLAVLSHELRTPLTPVLAALPLVRENPGCDDEMRELLDIMHRNVELEAHLIDDLLDLTRVAKGKVELHREPVRLCEVLLRAVNICRSELESRQIHFGVDMGANAPYMLEADVVRLQQVFWNLLRNAIKFTPPGGCVGIRCRQEGEEVVAEVTDSGIGIEPEVMQRLFKPFEQGEQANTRKYGGLGLGLAISKTFVEMHGGTVSVHSPGKGRGSTFQVRLPIVSAGEGSVVIRSDGSPVVEAVPPSTPLPLPKRILLVEDHADTARILARLLTESGFEVRTAGDVASALSVGREWDFDLLLSDLGLPDGSGVDVIHRLQALRPNVRAIALSGYGAEADIEQSREAGFREHVIKPVSMSVLKERIAAVMRGAA